MVFYLLKKGGMLLFSLWVVVTGAFLLMHAIPGDPFLGEQNIPQEVIDSLYVYYGLDQPLWKQYLKYFQEILSGHLGFSIVYQGRSVNQLIAEGFPISLQLGCQALFLAIPLGIFLGTLAAIQRSSWLDRLAMTLSTIGISVPSFVLATLFQFIFCMKFHLLPVARWGSFEHTILPTLALAALPTAFIARLTRSNMVEVLQQDYIWTAKAKGLSLFQVSMRHGLRNALLPVVGYLGPVTAHLLTGSFVIERIFAIPGLGQWMIHSIHGRDYPLILGLTIFFSAGLMISSFVVDLIYSCVDPRIKQLKRQDA